MRLSFSKYSKAELEAYDRKLHTYKACGRCERVIQGVSNGLCPDCQARTEAESKPLSYSFGDIRDPRLLSY